MVVIEGGGFLRARYPCRCLCRSVGKSLISSTDVPHPKTAFIPHKSFCRSQHPPESINLSFTITDMEDKLTSLCGKRLLRNGF